MRRGLNAPLDTLDTLDTLASYEPKCPFGPMRTPETLGAHRQAEELWQALVRGGCGAEAVVAAALAAAERRQWTHLSGAFLTMSRVFKYNRKASHPERGVGVGVAGGGGGQDGALAQLMREVADDLLRMLSDHFAPLFLHPSADPTVEDCVVYFAFACLKDLLKHAKAVEVQQRVADEVLKLVLSMMRHREWLSVESVVRVLAVLKHGVSAETLRIGAACLRHLADSCDLCERIKLLATAQEQSDDDVLEGDSSCTVIGVGYLEEVLLPAFLLTCCRWVELQLRTASTQPNNDGGSDLRWMMDVLASVLQRPLFGATLANLARQDSDAAEVCLLAVRIAELAKGEPPAGVLPSAVAVFAQYCSIACGFDVELLVDFMTSNETPALELVLVGCKAVASSSPEFVYHAIDEAGCDAASFREFLTAVATQLRRMHRKNLLPFNPAPLLRRIDEANLRLNQQVVP